MENEIGLETEFRESFMNVLGFLESSNIPIEAIYENKKPKFMPDDISKDWDIIQKRYSEEEKREKETGDIMLY